MAYAVPNSHIVQAVLSGRYHGQQWMNVVHFAPVAPPAGEIADGEANLDEIYAILDIADAGWTHLREAYTDNELKMDYIQLQYIYPTRFAYKRYDALVTEGNQVVVGAPPNVSGVITWQADTTGRDSRGSMHVLGIPASLLADGLIDDTIREPMAEEAAFLIEPFTPPTFNQEYEMILFHRAAPALSKTVTHFTVQRTSRVERRRTVGLGI